ncbi:dynamin family protein [Peribacillus sp. SCS-155]|uniref:dynamin family protein n=1 Tax=Peribacillus sedimenti TaxID=3115297 RepID=UPI0039064A12
MVSDNLLINKKFYETLIQEEEVKHPIQILGEAFLEEQKNDIPKLSEIRYAQGEVYFHYKDYEAAIFKWGSIEGELEPWAKKGSADAYYELGLSSTAEEIYKTIISDNLVLKAETALQLFALYLEEQRFDLASRTIKDVVSFNPDYENVTDVARAYFEERHDWRSAIDLAIQEGIRTGSVHWFDILQSYVDNGHTDSLLPGYFAPAFEPLFNADQVKFERLVLSLWNIYKGKECYFSWLETVNSFFRNTEIESFYTWPGLSAAYKDTFLELIDGRFYIKEIEHIIPITLENWLKLADADYSLFAAAAVLSWAEIFPDSINSLVINDAEVKLVNSRNTHQRLEESIGLYDTAINWGEKMDLQTSEKMRYLANELLQLHTRTILIAGTDGIGKSSFINMLAGEEVIREGVTAFVKIKNGEQPSIHEITSSDVTLLPDLESMSLHRSQRDSLFEIVFPSSFLEQNRLAFTDSPGLNSNFPASELFHHLHASDGVLFILDAQTPFTDRERDILLEMKKQVPYLQVHFILNKVDKIYNEQDAFRILEDTQARIHEFFPNAGVLAFSADSPSLDQIKDAAAFIEGNFHFSHGDEERTEKILYFIRQTLTALLERRVDIEKNLTDSIKWNEEMVVKLNGAINQVSDMENEKSKIITQSFRKIKDEVSKDLKEKIPELLKETAELVDEDSDFKRVHIDLNQLMNERIQNYVNRTVLPEFYQSLQDWIAESEHEFGQSQFYLQEMGDGFNTMYGEERLDLQCDFKVLDDWKRDADRMTSGVHIDDVNILLRHTPSQLLLKGTGMLLGSFSQNKTVLMTRYKRFLETEDYSEVASTITKKFLSQFELFEISLDRDVVMFFRNPASELEAAVAQSQQEIQDSQAALNKMREKPEVYRDPITLFEVRLRQYEWMQHAGK